MQYALAAMKETANCKLHTIVNIYLVAGGISWQVKLIYTLHQFDSYLGQICIIVTAINNNCFMPYPGSLASSLSFSSSVVTEFYLWHVTQNILQKRECCCMNGVIMLQSQ